MTYLFVVGVIAMLFSLPAMVSMIHAGGNL
jgi:hypothetical protein